MACHFNSCVVLLLSCKFNVSVGGWFSNFLKYLIVQFYNSLSPAFICSSPWILWLFMYQGAYRMDWNLLLEALEDFDARI
jgi:hypothetical protein